MKRIAANVLVAGLAACCLLGCFDNSVRSGQALRPSSSFSGTVYTTSRLMFHITADGTVQKTELGGADIVRQLGPGDYPVMDSHGREVKTVTVTDTGQVVSLEVGQMDDSE